MKRTIMMKVNPKQPETDRIRVAAELIRAGGIVAFPTETVYGLGADALNSEAVMKIFAAKERPPDNPLIVHIANKEDVYKLAREVPNVAEKLMTKFWPGPLTLILKRSRIVPDITAGGLDTIAIRMPDSEVALALIMESKVPIAAPSANLSGKPSPTDAKHVMDDLEGRLDAILDAGPTKVGIESTVLDMTINPPQILRPGGTSHEKLRSLLGRVKNHSLAISNKQIHIIQARSPGMKHKHYSPNAEVVVVEGKHYAVAKKVQVLANLYKKRGKRVGIMATDESIGGYNADVVQSIGSRKDLSTVAKNLFRLLRDFDDKKVDVIIAEGITPKDLGLAVMNRLRKAAEFNVVKA